MDPQIRILIHTKMSWILNTGFTSAVDPDCFIIPDFTFQIMPDPAPAPHTARKLCYQKKRASTGVRYAKG
jgi:hypothetical protein